MIPLDSFGDLGSINVGPFAAKPTSLTDRQAEATAALWSSADGLTAIGIWECTPGQFTADRTRSAEYCHILSGSATVVNADGTGARTVKGGDLLVLPLGWKGQWTVHEHIRKLYLINAVG